jgi:hypothetical protein
MPASVRRRLRHLAASVALGSIAFATGAAAQAQASPVSLATCDNSPLSQPFLPWADVASYKLVPGGDFEASLAGWTLSGQAGTVAGSEPSGVTGSVGSSSLALAAGAQATSPATCVDAAYPSFRFFARTDGPGSLLGVSVVYPGLLGGQVTVPVGVVSLSGAWLPTVPMLTGSAVPALLSDGSTPVQLRFTALTGSSQIDDVFVDPHGMH